MNKYQITCRASAMLLLCLAGASFLPAQILRAGGGSYSPQYTPPPKKKNAADPKPTPLPDYRKAFKEAAKAMDQVASDVEEFGSISMSIPLLTLPTDTLTFGLNNDAELYYRNAKQEVAGRALSVTKIAQSLSGDFQGAADLDAVAIGRSIVGINQQQNDMLSRQIDAINRQADAGFKRDVAIANKETTDAERQDAMATAYRNRAQVLSTPLVTPAPVATPAPPGLPGSAAVIVNAAPATGSGASTPAPTPTPQPLRVDNSLINATTILDTLPGFAPVDANGNPAATPKPFNDGLTLSDTSAVVAAESARSLQSLSNFFHSPNDAMQFKGKIVMMGAVTVSVQPGWRTQKGFAAEVSVHTKYVWKPAQRETIKRMSEDMTLPLPLRNVLAGLYGSGTNAAGSYKSFASATQSSSSGGASIPADLRMNGDFLNPDVTAPLSPLVSGISPLMQTETLDLASEFDRQDQFALALALALQGSGYKAQGKIFEQYVKNQRHQVQTRSASASVATYSNGGGIVGFQIGPRLKAIGDPSNRKSKSAMILERQSFPALLVFGLDATDLYPKMIFLNGRLAVFEPALDCQQQVHWNPLTHRFNTAWDWLNPLNGAWPPGWWEPAYTEASKIKHSLDKIEAFDKLDDVIDEYPDGEFKNSIERLKRNISERHLHNSARALGISSSTRFPAEIMVPNGRIRPPNAPRPDEPAVAAIFPPRANVTKKATPSAGDGEAIALQASAIAAAMTDFTLLAGPAMKGFETLDTVTLALNDDDVKVTAYAKSQLSGNPPPAPTEADKTAARDEIRRLASVLANLRQVQKGLVGQAAEIQKLGPASGTPPPTIDSTAAQKSVTLMQRQLEKLEARVASLKSFPAARLAKIKELIPAANIAEATVASDRLAFISASVIREGTGIVPLLSAGPDDPIVPITVVGENLDKVERIVLTATPGAVDFLQVGQAAVAELSTRVSKNQILLKIRVHATTEIHLQLFYEVPSPDDPAKKVTRSIFTPSVLVNMTTSGEGGAAQGSTAGGGESVYIQSGATNLVAPNAPSVPTPAVPVDPGKVRVTVPDTGGEKTETLAITGRPASPAKVMLDVPAVNALQLGEDLFPMPSSR